MKENTKRISFILIGCLAVFATTLTSCKKEENKTDVTNPNIVGTWKMVELYGTVNGEEYNLKDANFPISVIMVFNSDGTYTGMDEIEESGFNEAYGTNTVTEKGTWRLSGSKLTVTGTTTIGDRQVQGATVYTVKKLTATELAIETSASNGEISVFASATFQKIK